MRNLALLFCGIFFTLAFSFSGLILSSNNILVGYSARPKPLMKRVNFKKGKSFSRGLCRVWPNKANRFILRWVVCIVTVSRSDVLVLAEMLNVDGALVHRFPVIISHKIASCWEPCEQGPDLMNVGGRPLNADWHHLHLYNPQITSEHSNMPPFAFLYQFKQLSKALLRMHCNFLQVLRMLLQRVMKVVPTRKAEALVAYLLSLKLDYSVPEAPIL